MYRDRPVALVFVAGALLCFGLFSIAETLVAWNSGLVYLNIGFIFVPMAIGLLRLSAGWRTFALYSLGLTAIGQVAYLGYELFCPGQLAVNWFGTRAEGVLRYAILIGFIGVGSVVVGFAIRTLTRAEIRILFRPHAEP